MHVIICRNVIIYFNKELQNSTLNLFYKSLNNGCFLCLGTKEGIKFSDTADNFEQYVEGENIFQRKFTLD